MRPDHGPSMSGFSFDQISSRFDSLKNDQVQFPGDSDNISLYYAHNRKDEIVSNFPFLLSAIFTQVDSYMFKYLLIAKFHV